MNNNQKNKTMREVMHRINHKGREVILCDVSLSHFKKYTWHWQRSGTLSYLCRTENKQTIPFHRDILGLKKGDSLCGDHINGNTQDNRMSNLRVVTRTQSNINRRAYNKEGLPRNIYRSRAKRESYRLVIRGVHYGTYHSVDEAVVAQVTLYDKIHGQFSMSYLRGGKL